MENGKWKRKKEKEKYLCLSLVFIASGHAWKQLDLAFMCWIWKSIKRETCRNVLHNFSFFLSFSLLRSCSRNCSFFTALTLNAKEGKDLFCFVFFHSSDCERKVDFMEL